MIVEINDSGKRIDKYLNENTEYTRSKIQKMIENGNILVNDIKVKDSYKVKENDYITIEALEETTDILPENIPLDIYYEDDDLIDKPIAEFLKEHDVSQCIFISPKLETIKEIKEIEIPKFKDVEIKNQSKCLTNPEEKPWSITYCDIANLDSSKGNGIKKFCEIMNIDLKDTIAFGDDYNDVPMFETVGHAVVMGNANYYIKKNYADEIAEDNNLDGVAKVLERILEEGV